MTKKDIVDYIVNNTTLRRSQAIAAIDSMADAITGSLVRGESVHIRGFATIKFIITKPRKARDITRKTVVSVPPKKSAKLMLCKALRERLNN